MTKKESAPVVEHEPISESPAKVQSVPKTEPVQKAKRRRWGLKLFFWLLVFGTFGTGFALVGIYVSREVIPEVENWLIAHNFREVKQGYEPTITVPAQQGNDSGESIPQVVKKSSPSVVSIAIVNSASNGSANGTEIESDNIGTGFIVDSNGIIVTNQHVVRDLKATYQVVTQDNKTYKPKSIIRDEVNDVALIIVDAKGLPALPLGNSSSVEVGGTVIAIGTPLGEYPGSVTVGVVSGIGRSVKTGDGFWETQKEYENVIQTDAAINPGNSGGPLLNLSGQVIGVNFATTGGADNISFALPIDLVTQKISDYKQYGKFRTPYLGVTYRMVTSQEAEFYAVEPGALIKSVSDNSPAKNSGLKVGDIVTKLNGKSVSTSLASSLARFAVGDTVTLTISRSSLSGEPETVTITVTLADRPAEN